MPSTLKPNHISAMDAAERTGCTYRQLDYWISHGVFAGVRHPGTGNYRSIPGSLIPVIRAVADVAGAFRGANISTDLLREVAVRYSDGMLWLDNGVAITWKVPS